MTQGRCRGSASSFASSLLDALWQGRRPLLVGDARHARWQPLLPLPPLPMQSSSYGYLWSPLLCSSRFPVVKLRALRRPGPSAPATLAALWGAITHINSLHFSFNLHHYIYPCVLHLASGFQRASILGFGERVVAHESSHELTSLLVIQYMCLVPWLCHQ